MRGLTILLALLLCVSCATRRAAFVQGDIRIVLPVEQETNSDGHQISIHWNDGGTVRVSITDATGKTFDVYFDHRISVTPSGTIKTEPGTIYLKDYPARSNAVLVVDQEGFRNNVLKGIRY